jgi:hypothetical protein
MGTSLACVCMVGFMLGAPAQSQRVQKDLAQDKVKYETANNPVDRAKAFVKLGHEEYVAARRALDSGNTDEALQFLTDYSDQATETHDALLKSDVDPEKHSNGFRQLQISIRERERDLRDLMGRVAFDQRGPFEKLDKAMNGLNQRLMQELFPNRPPNKQAEPKNPQE